MTALDRRLLALAIQRATGRETSALGDGTGLGLKILAAVLVVVAGAAYASLVGQ